MEVFLSVVIPSYNEMANLQKGVLDKIAHFLGKQKFTYEIIVVDDGSTDGSIEFAEEFVKENPHFKILKNSHLGKAGAVTAGMLKAKGQWRLFTDMDQAAPIDELSKLLPLTNKKFDIIIGSRSDKRKDAPFSRVVMAKGMIITRKIIVGIRNIEDTQCGFKMFSGKAADALFSRLNKFHHGFKAIKGSSVTAGFDVELLYLAQKMGFRIKEVPIQWLYVESRRVSAINDSIEGLLELFRIKMNAIAGKYKKLSK